MSSQKELKQMLKHANQHRYAIILEDRIFWSNQIKKIEELMIPRIAVLKINSN